MVVGWKRAMNRNEIVLGYLLQAEQYLDFYLEQLQLAQQTAFPQNLQFFITANQFQIQYLYYFQLVNDPCASADNPEQCYKDELLTYGVTISSTLPLTAEQLPFALSAVQMVANRLVELLAEYNEVAVSAYDPKAIFQDVFGALIFEYNPAIDYSTGSGTDRITLGTNLLNQADEDDPRRTSIIEGVIIHELGHVFENLLGLVPNRTEFVVETQLPLASERLISDPNRLLEIFVSGVPAVVEGYLNATGQYWSGNLEYEFGDWLRSGGFQASDAVFRVQPLTAQIYNALRPPENHTVCNGGGDSCYVDRNGNEITSPKYIAQAGTFIFRGYSAATDVDFLYFNERRVPDPVENTPGSNPMEGFADTFSAFIRLGTEFVLDSDDGPFPPNELRRIFFEENFSCWLEQRLGIAVGGCNP